MKIGVEYKNGKLLIIKNNQIFSSINKTTLEEFQLTLFSKDEMILKIEKDLEFIPVAAIIKKNEKLLDSVSKSTENLFFLNHMNDVVYANDLFEDNSFVFFIQELIDFSNSKFKFLTLIDESQEDLNNKNNEFVYDQIRLRCGEINDDTLREKILNLALINSDKERYYTKEDLNELNPYSVLLSHFILRKDVRSLPFSE